MLHVHRSASPDALVDALAGLLRQPAGDAFAPEIVAVPAKGVERWLAQRLSHRLGAGSGAAGVCANVQFPGPDRLLDQALAATGPEAADAVAQWDPDRAVWPLLEALSGSADCPGAAPADSARRYAAAARLAANFARYGQERPAMLRFWAAGNDVLDDGRPLPTDLAWQPPLWRRLRETLGPSPGEVLPEAVTRLRSDAGVVDLPDRLSIYGPTRFTTARLEVLAALAAGRDVHVWLNHASPAAWDAVAAGHRPEHPLLASMGREVEALQQRLAAVAPEAVQHLHAAPAPTDDLLGRLKSALANDRVPAAADRPVLDTADASVVVHSCHGRARQVEVLREALLQRLAADPTLQPRDVLVMCPDIDEFAPLVAAAFSDAGGVAGHPAGRLRVRLADRAPQTTNPLLAITATLLRLAAGRVTASDVLDLAATGPVRRRFGFDTDDATRLRDWVGASRISWGLSGEHRADYGLGGIVEGTWRDGLDRLLLGATMEPEAGWLGDATPCDDVDSADLDLLGRFAELLDRLTHALRAFRAPWPVEGWTELLRESVLAVAAPLEPWQGTAFTARLAELAADAAGHDVTLSLADMTELWERRCVARPTRSGFRTGGLTVATMVPMRSVPHRVVALLGLDEGTFPRSGVVDGDDLLSRDRRAGERDPRSEDRQLLLDAVCAAGEHLLIFCTGADERTGLSVPPAVPLGELLDALDALATTPEGRVSREVTVRHRLQAYHPENFATSAALVRQASRRPVSFDVAAVAGARALLRDRAPEPPLLGELLPAVPAADVELDDLRSMLVHPARAFLLQRLGVRLPFEEADPPDELPVKLDALAEWAIGERFLNCRLRDLTVDHCLGAERRRGTLPPGMLGHSAAIRIGQAAEAITSVARTHTAIAADNLDVSTTVPVGGVSRTVAGTVAGVRGSELVRVSYSRVGPKHLLSAWLELLALTAARPHTAWRAVVIGRNRQDGSRRVLGPVEAGEAETTLADLIALYDRGLRGPLPLPLKTAHCYAEAVRRGSNSTNALRAAAAEWQRREGGESSDPANVLVWGPEADVESLAAAGLGNAATLLWDPVLRAAAGVSR
jgi:exodeoxyribonuclease V gamma subunit